MLDEVRGKGNYLIVEMLDDSRQTLDEGLVIEGIQGLDINLEDSLEMWSSRVESCFMT